MEDQRSYSAVAYGIPSLDEETNSRYRALLKRVDYKLSYVTRTGSDTVRRQSWKEMSKELHRRYIKLSDKEVRIASGFLQKMGVRPEDDDLKKITTIEDYFKTNITISNGVRTIGVTAFGSCTKLANLTLPDSISSLGAIAFELCTEA